MSMIVDGKGKPRLGILNERVTDVNYANYSLETPMGTRIPDFLKNTQQPSSVSQE